MKGKSYHRREFVRALAIGAAAPGVLAAAEPNDEAKDDDPLRTEVDARMALIVARFGDKLDEEARASVRSEVELIVRRAEGLRKFALENGDGPFPVFRPYRAND